MDEVVHTGGSHLGEHMHIASHLWQSPHGVYYFRETQLVSGKQVSRRISLHTKDPVEARDNGMDHYALVTIATAKGQHQIAAAVLALSPEITGRINWAFMQSC
jgi:hypothetical protein